MKRLIAMAIIVGAVITTSTVTTFALGYTVTDLGAYYYAQSINNSGQAVGLLPIAPYTYAHAALFNNGTITDLGAPGVTSRAYSINDSGQIAGTFTAPNGIARAALFSNGTTTDLGTLGGVGSSAYDINNLGQIVGGANPLGKPEHAALFYNGTVKDLGTLGGAYSQAFSLNDVGQAVGVSSLAGSTSAIARATLYDINSGAVSDLGDLGGSGGAARSINNSGLAVGFSYLFGDIIWHAALYDTINGTITDIGASTHLSQALSINNLGQAVGYSDSRAALFYGGEVIDLNTLLALDTGWILKEAYCNNDFGQIVGRGTINGVDSAFLLTPDAVYEQTPVPEPSTLFLLGGGLIGLSLWWKKRLAKKPLSTRR